VSFGATKKDPKHHLPLRTGKNRWNPYVLELRALRLSPKILHNFAIGDSPEALTNDALFLNKILNEERQLLARLPQVADLQKCYQVEQKKRREVNAVAFPVEGTCDDFISANEVERNAPDDRCRAEAKAADHCEEGKKVIAPHLWHGCEDDPCIGYIEGGSGNATDEVQKTNDMPFARYDSGRNEEPTGYGSTKKHDRHCKHGLAAQALDHFSKKRQARERPDERDTRQIQDLGDTEFRKLV